MSKKIFMIDTGCAPVNELVEKYNVELMGMKVIIDEKTYTDGEDISLNEFYEKISHTENFHTAHPSIGEIVQKYNKLKEEGYDEIVDIHFSSRMSGLLNTCEIAKNMTENLDIKLFDTEYVSIGAYHVSEKILELYSRDFEYEQILEVLPKIKESTYMQFSVPTLKYLVKNGRVGKAAGIAGTLLSIKPVLGVEDGFIAPIAKPRGMIKAYNTIAENAVKFLEKRPHNVSIYITYGLEKNKEQMEEAFNIFMEKFEKLNIKDYKIIRGRLRPTIICHSGPEVFGLSVYGEETPI